MKGYDLLSVFKEEADDIRKQIDVMMNVLVEKAEVIQDEMHDESRKDYKKLKGDIKQQRDENELIYKDMKKLLKETESQRQKITVFTAKIEELEQHVGILSNAPALNNSLSMSEVLDINEAVAQESSKNLGQH
jgi:polyhydroxyalkanoate synthesis regulator phasin